MARLRAESLPQWLRGVIVSEVAAPSTFVDSVLPGPPSPRDQIAGVRLGEGDTLVVLGCRVALGRLSSAAARRCQRAANAWARGGFARIIVSGGKRWGDTLEAEQMAVRLVELGVPSQAILCELLSLNTYENAYYTSRILKHFGTETPLVVTCAFHLPRALREFERQGLVPTGLAADDELDQPSGDLANEIALGRPSRRHWARPLLERCRGWLQAPLHPLWSL